MTKRQRKIVVACDSMKGSLTAREVCRAVAQGVACVDPDVRVVEMPVADGGEGTVDAVAAVTGAALVSVAVRGPLPDMRVEACYAVAGTTAVIEMAAASGLTLVPAGRRDPLATDTAGTGMLIADAAGRGCREIVVGLGGSATCDGGMGLLTALGARCTDADGRLLEPSGAAMGRVARIDLSGLDRRLDDVVITIASDVDNPLYGDAGAARVFARQKGADDAAVELLDRGLRQWSAALAEATSRDCAMMPGAGAAGGLGVALMAVFGARRASGIDASGIDVVLDTVGFDRAVDDADLVITGEGHLDRQTLMGKAPWGVLQRCQRCHVPCIAIGGGVTDSDALLAAGFTAVHAVTPPSMLLTTAMQPEAAAANIIAAVARIARP